MLAIYGLRSMVKLNKFREYISIFILQKNKKNKNNKANGRPALHEVTTPRG
jgi:hypothetical protein